jgi:hypothetical protein
LLSDIIAPLVKEQAFSNGSGIAMIVRCNLLQCFALLIFTTKVTPFGRWDFGKSLDYSAFTVR